MSAVELNLAKLRTRASGKNTINCTRMKYWTGISVKQFVTPKTKAWNGGGLVSELMDIRPGWMGLLGDSPQRRSCRQLRSPVEILQSTPESGSASMAHTKFHQCLMNDCQSMNFTEAMTCIPPKLPETTNLVFTNSRNEYKEMQAMKTKVIDENSKPPL